MPGGRPRGARNRRTVEFERRCYHIEKRLREEGLEAVDPIEVLYRLMQPCEESSIRVSAATQLCKYQFPTMKAIEVTPDGLVPVESDTGGGAQLQLAWVAPDEEAA